MGSDLYMNPPAPNAWVALRKTQPCVLASYRYQPDRIYRHADSDWVRVGELVRGADGVRIASDTMEMIGVRVVDVPDGLFLNEKLSVDTMRDVLHPPQPVYTPKHERTS